MVGIIEIIEIWIDRSKCAGKQYGLCWLSLVVICPFEGVCVLWNGFW